MNIVRNIIRQNGLSSPVIIFSGFIAAVFLTITLFTVRYLIHKWSPTPKNIERMLVRKKYGEALALAGGTYKGSNLDSSEASLINGKIWLAIAWEKMNLDEWRSYGKNPGDWFDLPEASKAESYLIDAIEKNTNNYSAHYYLGILYMEKGWYPAGEVEFLTALKINETDLKSRQNLAVLYSKTGRFEQAKNELLSAHRIAPEDPSIMKNLAILYRFYLNQPESSMVWANRYLSSGVKGDMDINILRDEFNKMAERYPELVPEEPLRWKKESSQKTRKHFNRQ